MTRRQHSMPFGAEVLESGEVRFNLWAPSALSVDLCLEKAEHMFLPMTRKEDGWFSRVTDLAGHGSRYRFRIDNELLVPDPASRGQAGDVHGASIVVDPGRYCWSNGYWQGRPWEEAVIYELHVGCFSEKGSFRGVIERLTHLAAVGVTAIELMPIAAFPGQRNWGYDGTLLFSPAECYGPPEALKELVEAAHARNIMVLLDVVYNHFGPEGNYLYRYAAPFFTDISHTPWGKAINFSGLDSIWVRQFYIHNALYWLEEYHLDGLRLDAVHSIFDTSSCHILEEIAAHVRNGPGRKRHVHLILENDNNESRYLRRDVAGRPVAFTAQWNDDCHHASHVLLTGEKNGYYQDVAEAPLSCLGRCIAEGFAFQGEPSGYRGGKPRGELSSHLPATAFVGFLQNHDQVGNRAMGERISSLTNSDRLQAMLAILLLAPSPPLLFMGEEWGTRRPFPFFCDFAPGLAKQVTAGRRREFAGFPDFSNPALVDHIPDPGALNTFQSAVLDWEEIHSPRADRWLTYYRNLLLIRHRHMVPLLARIQPGGAWTVTKEGMLQVKWSFADDANLHLLTNLGAQPQQVGFPAGTLVFSTHAVEIGGDKSMLPPWSVFWFLATAPGRGAG